MKIACMMLSAFLGFASLAFAGNVYGTISEGGKPVAQGVKLEIGCGDKNHETQTDASGAFKVFVPEKGKCMLKVTYQGQTPAFEINSYDGSVQYDLILEKQGGQYALKRK